MYKFMFHGGKDSVATDLPRDTLDWLGAKFLLVILERNVLPSVHGYENLKIAFLT